MFDIFKFQAYPAIHGAVTMNGKPVQNAEITTTSTLEKREYSSTCITDEGGKFSFKEKNIYSIRGILPVENHLYQKITIKYNYVEYTAWEALKFCQTEDPELSKLLSSLQCELTEPVTDYVINADSVHMNVVHGLARWSN